MTNFTQLASQLAKYCQTVRSPNARRAGSPDPFQQRLAPLFSLTVDEPFLKILHADKDGAWPAPLAHDDGFPRPLQVIQDGAEPVSDFECVDVTHCFALVPICQQELSTSNVDMSMHIFFR